MVGVEAWLTGKGLVTHGSPAARKAILIIYEGNIENIQTVIQEGSLQAAQNATTHQPTKLQKLWSATTPQLDEWKAVDSVLDWFDKFDKLFLDHQGKMIALFSETSYLVAKMIVMMTILPQMLPISSQSLNGANSAARRAAEGLEKLNHQNLTPKIMSKSNPVHLWRFGRTKALKIQ